MRLFTLSCELENGSLNFYIVQAKNETDAIEFARSKLDRDYCIENLNDTIDYQYDGFAELTTPF